MQTQSSSIDPKLSYINSCSEFKLVFTSPQKAKKDHTRPKPSAATKATRRDASRKYRWNQKPRRIMKQSSNSHGSMRVLYSASQTLTPFGNRHHQAIKDSGEVSEEHSEHVKAAHTTYRANIYSAMRTSSLWVQQRKKKGSGRSSSPGFSVFNASSSTHTFNVVDLITPPESAPIASYVDRTSASGHSVVQELVRVNLPSPLKRTHLNEVKVPTPSVELTLRDDEADNRYAMAPDDDNDQICVGPPPGSGV
ncbi:hypothetical protein K438DRAFT_1782970 [Mycena galopus ATCC 62051]|nr:hypothetical protein K438DRAFT_1782970 [Mycena galopus ATCC 62051]